MLPPSLLQKRDMSHMLSCWMQCARADRRRQALARAVVIAEHAAHVPLAGRPRPAAFQVQLKNSRSLGSMTR